MNKSRSGKNDVFSNSTPRTVAHPVGAAVCLTAAYVVLCSACMVFLPRIAAGAARTVEEARRIELLAALASVGVVGAAFFALAVPMLKRISAQHRGLALVSNSVHDCLFLLRVEPEDSFRFVSVNESFLKVRGLTRDLVVGKRIEDVVPQASQDLLKKKCREAIRENRAVIWEETVRYPAGERSGEVAVTPITDKRGRATQLLGAVLDKTRGKQTEAEVRDLSGHLLQLQDEERRRIGRELHDTIGQELAAVSMNLGLVQQRIEGRDVTVDNFLSDSQAIIEQCTRDIRTLSYLLHPPLLDEVGLTGAAREYAVGFTQRSGIKVTIDVSPALGRLPADAERALFRVLQESLANVHRHSGSATAAIRLWREDSGVVVEVKDAGHGLPPDMLVEGDGPVTRVGVGVAGMRERLRQLGGQFTIESSERGTTVRAMVPVPEGGR